MTLYSVALLTVFIFSVCVCIHVGDIGSSQPSSFDRGCLPAPQARLTVSKFQQLSPLRPQCGRYGRTPHPRSLSHCSSLPIISSPTSQSGCPLFLTQRNSLCVLEACSSSYLTALNLSPKPCLHMLAKFSTTKSHPPALVRCIYPCSQQTSNP